MAGQQVSYFTVTGASAMPVTSIPQDAWNAQDIELRTTAAADAKQTDARVATALEERNRKPSREELVWLALMGMPQVTRMTEGNMVDSAVQLVDAYLARFPGAVRP